MCENFGKTCFVVCLIREDATAAVYWSRDDKIVLACLDHGKPRYLVSGFGESHHLTTD